MKKTILVLSCLISFIFASALSAQDSVSVAELLRPYVDANELPGMVAVIATKDRVLQVDSFGYADVEAKKPMGVDTFFWVASQTKPVTAVAVMMLVEEGKLSLDEPVARYLPELKDLQVIAEKDASRTVLVPPDRPVTLRQLLCHTSGVIFLSPMQQRFGIDSLPHLKALTMFVATPLVSQPGTKYQYSNIGIDIAAAAVERAADMPLEAFLQKRLFDPLGMKETTFWPTTEQLKRLAKPYRLDKEKNILVETRINFLTYPLDDRSNRFAEGGGGLFSTPADWVRFYQMLAGEGEFEGKRILSAESVREIRTKQTGDLPESYGLGVNINGDRFGHGGSHGTNSTIDTKTGRIAMYFIQQEGLTKSGEAQGRFFKMALDQ